MNVQPALRAPHKRIVQLRAVIGESERMEVAAVVVYLSLARRPEFGAADDQAGPGALGEEPHRPGRRRRVVCGGGRVIGGVRTRAPLCPLCSGEAERGAEGRQETRPKRQWSGFRVNPEFMDIFDAKSVLTAMKARFSHLKLDNISFQAPNGPFDLQPYFPVP